VFLPNYSSGNIETNRIQPVSACLAFFEAIWHLFTSGLAFFVHLDLATLRGTTHNLCFLQVGVSVHHFLCIVFRRRIYFRQRRSGGNSNAAKMLVGQLAMPQAYDRN